jgi:hypothetical protein
MILIVTNKIAHLKDRIPHKAMKMKKTMMLILHLTSIKIILLLRSKRSRINHFRLPSRKSLLRERMTSNMIMEMMAMEVMALLWLTSLALQFTKLAAIRRTNKCLKN